MSLDRMGLQVSCGVRAQGPKASDLWADAAAIGTDFPCTGATKGMPDSGRTSDAGPRAYVYRHSPQVSGGFGDRVPQGEERHCHCPTVWQRTHLRRRALLGPGYAVSTVGFELEQICQYIRDQEDADGTGGRW